MNCLSPTSMPTCCARSCDTSKRNANAASPAAISALQPSTRLPASSQSAAQNIWTGAPNSALSKPSALLPGQSAISRSRKSTLYWMHPAKSQNSAIGIAPSCSSCTTRARGRKKLAKLCIEDLSLHSGGDGALSSVRLNGKGGKVRICPLWTSTTVALRNLVAGRSGKERVFLNRRSEPLTRFGIHEIVTRYAHAAMNRVPEMRKKRIGPHTIRHTTATHLLRAGVDINTIRAWLGHVSINTTNIYAETDLEMKARALGLCAVKSKRSPKRWRDNPDLMSFLAQL